MSFKQLFIFFIFFILSNNSIAQTQNQYIKAGEKAYNSGEYFAAISYFERASLFNTKTDEIHTKIGNAYLELKDYDQAIKSYNKVNLKNTTPIIYYNLGKSLMLNGDYETAIVNFEKFKINYKTQDIYFADALQKMASCYWAKDHSKFDESIIIKALDENINTEFSEFAPGYFKDSLIQITSFFQNEENKKGDYISEIFFFKKNNDTWEKHNLSFAKNKTQEPANGFYLPEKDRFYFNLCEVISNGKRRCDLYVSTFENNVWNTPILLNINDKKFTTTQASVYVNNEDKDVIFFASDREGGFGGLDIWTATEMEYGIFSEPNILPININTSGEEESPFYDKNTGLLYFSSDWHYGFGGLDIFKVVLNKENASPQNLGLPYNSSANDLYFKYNNTQKGFFSSNRKGAMKLRGVSCCYDAFSFEKDDEKLLVAQDLISPLDSLVSIHKNDSIQKLFNRIEEMLPITVYFHNDEPNPKTTDTSTLLSYTDVYNSYVNLKNDYFKQTDTKEIESFFSTELEKGFTDLKTFEKLLASISNDYKIKIQLKGYCSPLAENDYNFNLSKRRISALINYFRSNEIIYQALKSGRFILEELPYGEEKAASNVSDNYFNTQLSIYNKKAAMERKVSIVGIVIDTF